MESNNKKKIAVILGARPNFIKAAPFFKEAINHPEFEFVLIHTGQHFDDNMSKIFFDEMGIPKPHIHLDTKGEFHTEKIGKMFNGLKDVFEKEKFDAAIVFGDVNSTLAGGIASAKNNCHLIHIEAGLRSHDRRMPEEINRAVVDHLSELLFTTEPSANNNLIKEGITQDKIRYVGNILTESIEVFKDKINNSNIVESLGLDKKQYVLITVHRQENTDSASNLKEILSMLNEINKKRRVVFPLHPGTRKIISEYNLDHLIKDLIITEPLGYFEFMKLALDSKGVITDSGGIQEETTYLGIPCCTLRDNTERPITLKLGSNKLFPIKLESVSQILEHLNRDDFKPRNIPLWDDKVSKRIFDCLKKEYFK